MGDRPPAHLVRCIRFIAACPSVGPLLSCPILPPPAPACLPRRLPPFAPPSSHGRCLVGVTGRVQLPHRPPAGRSHRSPLPPVPPPQAVLLAASPCLLLPSPASRNRPLPPAAVPCSLFLPLAPCLPILGMPRDPSRAATCGTLCSQQQSGAGDEGCVLEVRRGASSVRAVRRGDVVLGDVLLLLLPYERWI